MKRTPCVPGHAIPEPGARDRALGHQGAGAEQARAVEDLDPAQDLASRDGQRDDRRRHDPRHERPVDAVDADERLRCRALLGRVLDDRGAFRGLLALTVREALWLADQGRPYTKESAMTKWWGPRLAVDTIHQCLLLHGHYGYTDELPFEQRMRDVIGLEIGDGAAEVMKMVVARELMGRESLPY